MTKPTVPAPDGTVTTTRDQQVIRFQRTFAHPVTEVWAAITETAHLRNWLSDGEPVIEPRVGGRVVLDVVDSTVQAYDPPHTLAFGWESPAYPEQLHGVVTFRLREGEQGTDLILTHAEQASDASEAPSGPTAAWHQILDRLAAEVEGHPIPWTDEEWEAQRVRYATLFGEE